MQFIRKYRRAYSVHFGKDIFGFESSGRRMSGPFGDELAGGFIQRFFFCTFCTFIVFQKS